MAKRTFDKPNYDWTMPFYELREICEEVYGVPFDLQMGERGQGEYEVATTGDIQERQGYWTGLGQGYGYEGKYIEGNKYVFFDEIDGVEDDCAAAIEKWVNQTQTEWHPGKFDWDRPFDKVGDNGEYTFYQPDLDVVLTDLAKRDEIPEGTYMIRIEW